MAQSARETAAPSPFHWGEVAVHARVGVRERLEQIGPRVLREFMPDEHRELFAKLPMLVVGSLDAQRRPWASVIVARPGFIASADARTLAVSAAPAVGDPLRANLAVGAPIAFSASSSRRAGAIARTARSRRCVPTAASRCASAELR